METHDVLKTHCHIIISSSEICLLFKLDKRHRKPTNSSSLIGCEASRGARMAGVAVFERSIIRDAVRTAFLS